MHHELAIRQNSHGTHLFLVDVSSEPEQIPDSRRKGKLSAKQRLLEIFDASCKGVDRKYKRMNSKKVSSTTATTSTTTSHFYFSFFGFRLAPTGRYGT